MPIEIKEISIKADIYPERKQPQQTTAVTALELERLKKELKKEILAELKQKQQQNFER